MMPSTSFTTSVLSWTNGIKFLQSIYLSYSSALSRRDAESSGEVLVRKLHHEPDTPWKKMKLCKHFHCCVDWVIPLKKTVFHEYLFSHLTYEDSVTQNRCSLTGFTREYWMIYRGHGLLAVVWFGFSLALPLTERGWGRGRNHIIRQRESLVLCTSLNTLWVQHNPTCRSTFHVYPFPCKFLCLQDCIMWL